MNGALLSDGDQAEVWACGSNQYENEVGETKEMTSCLAYMFE